jgi:hypothetical protein
MKTRALLLVLLFIALAGCTVKNPSVQIQSICYPTDDCTFGDTCNKHLIGDPVVDPGASSSVVVYLQVSNQLSNNADERSMRVNTHDAHVEEIVISGLRLPISSKWIPAEGSTVLGVALPAVAGKFEVQLRGRFDDGSEFETAEFPIVVRTCSGCVGSCDSGKVACPGPGQLPFTCFDPAGAGTI